MSPQWIPERLVSLGRFATERHNIYIRRFEQKLPPPWTDDPILARNHFCNVFRRLDRGTRYVEERILPFGDSHPELTIFNVVAYRRFNLPDTHDALSASDVLGGRYPGFLVNWGEARAFEVLAERMRRGIQVFGSAWRVQPTRARGEFASLRTQCERITVAWDRRAALYQRLRDASTFASAVRILTSLPGVGDFVAAEIALDLDYTQTILRFSEDDFVRVGPGARQGLDLMVTAPLRTDLAYEDAVRQLHRTQDEWLAPAGFQGPRLTVCDAQFLCCEARKYWVAKETGHHKRRYTPRVAVREPV